jgi:DNA-binding transcriptional MerR regulator
MLIGELSSKTGLSRDTIRFYEKHGLITVERNQRRQNNYKEYSVNILSRISKIKSLKNYGFTLNEIKEIIALWETGSFACEEEKPKVLDKIQVIEDKIKELIEIKDRLNNSIQNCPTNCDIVKVLDKSNN